MSIKAISWAWTQQVKSSQKLVLMALADSADDFGEARVSQSFLAWKTEYSERFVRKAITELEEAGLMTRVRTTRRDGTRGVDGLVLHLEKASSKAAWGGLSEVRRQLQEQVAQRGLPAGEDFGPDLVATQPEGIAPSQSHRNDVPVAEAPAVDNSVSPSGNHRNSVPVEGSYRNVVPGLPERGSGSDPADSLLRAHVFYPSSSSVGAEAPVDNDDDEMTTTDGPGSESKVSRIHRGVNLSRLAAECAPAAGQWPVPVWAAAVDLILGRARSRVARPQRYVAGAIASEPAVMLDAAESVAGSDAALGEALWAGSNASAAQPAPPRRVTCPIHFIDHRDGGECGGCRADRLAERPQEG